MRAARDITRGILDLLGSTIRLGADACCAGTGGTSI